MSREVRMVGPVVCLSVQGGPDGGVTVWFSDHEELTKSHALIPMGHEVERLRIGAVVEVLVRPDGFGTPPAEGTACAVGRLVRLNACGVGDDDVGAVVHFRVPGWVTKTVVTIPMKVEDLGKLGPSIGEFVEVVIREL